MDLPDPNAFYLAVLGDNLWLYSRPVTNWLQTLPVEVHWLIQQFFIVFVTKARLRIMGTRAAERAQRWWPHTDVYSDPFYWLSEFRQMHNYLHHRFLCSCQKVRPQYFSAGCGRRTRVETLRRAMRNERHTWTVLAKCSSTGREEKCLCHDGGCEIAKVHWAYCLVANALKVNVWCTEGYHREYSIGAFPHPGRETGDAATEQKIWEQAQDVDAGVQAVMCADYKA